MLFCFVFISLVFGYFCLFLAVPVLKLNEISSINPGRNFPIIKIVPVVILNKIHDYSDLTTLINLKLVSNQTKIDTEHSLNFTSEKSLLNSYSNAIKTENLNILGKILLTEKGKKFVLKRSEEDFSVLWEIALRKMDLQFAKLLKTSGVKWDLPYYKKLHLIRTSAETFNYKLFELLVDFFDIANETNVLVMLEHALCYFNQRIPSNITEKIAQLKIVKILISKNYKTIKEELKSNGFYSVIKTKNIPLVEYLITNKIIDIYDKNKGFPNLFLIIDYTIFNGNFNETSTIDMFKFLLTKIENINDIKFYNTDIYDYINESGISDDLKIKLLSCLPSNIINNKR